MLNFTLTQDEANLLLAGLNVLALDYNMSTLRTSLIVKMQEQAKAQLEMKPKKEKRK